METKKKTIIDECDFALKFYLQLDQGMARTKQNKNSNLDKKR